MKTIETYLRVNPKDQTEIQSVKHCIDQFGKDYFFVELFEKYSRKDQRFSEKDKLDAQAENIFSNNNYTGWKL